MAAGHAEDAGAAATTNDAFDVILPFASDASDSDTSTESDSGTSASSLSSGELYLRFLWEFLEPRMGCGYIDFNSFLWGCAWLHVSITSDDRSELGELFQYYGDRGRLPPKRFRTFLHSWGDVRQSILLRRCVMVCDWHI